MIGGELQYRVFFPQLAAPVGKLALLFSRFQPVALPYRIIGILDRERRKEGSCPCPSGRGTGRQVRPRRYGWTRHPI